MTNKQKSILFDVSDYKRKTLLVSFKTRMVSIFVAFMCIVLMDRFIGISIPNVVACILFIWLFLCVLYYFVFYFFRKISDRAFDNIHLSYYFSSVVVATFLVHYLGGAEWIAFTMYIFDIIYANFLMRRPRGIFVTLWVIVCYFFLLFAEYNGIVPHYRIIPMYRAAYNDLAYVLSTSVLIAGALFLLITYVAGSFSKMRDDRERDILAAKGRLEMRTQQLEMVRDNLRGKVRENEFLRSRAEKYLEKEKKQLEEVRKGQEKKIEELITTKRAMHQMIEDLNEMSRELQKIRDNLEQKVKERTEEILKISSKLHRSEKLAFMGKLAGSVTHELRNPMAVIKNSVYFLGIKLGQDADPKVLEHLGMIDREIKSIDSIIENIMGFAGKRKTDLTPGDMRDIADKALAAIDVPELVRVEKEFSHVPEILINSEQLIHSITNIVNNAIMAMKGNGTITLRIAENDKFVYLRITDTGGGIPEEYRELIFEPLYSTRPRGTGLGLPIAKMMIEGQNGKIDLDSEMGKGTTFTISMPKAEIKT